MHPIVPGVPYSVVVIAETGGGAGEESERTLFFSKELSMLTVSILCVYCMYQVPFKWYVCNDDYIQLMPSKPDPWLVCVVLLPL